MKTVNFSTLDIETDGEDIVLTAFCPSEGRVVMRMTADEFHLFSVEAGNKLHDARVTQKTNRQKRELLREQRR